MAALTVLLQVLLVIVSVLLVGVILLQRNKGQGAGIAFGGMGEAVFGSEMGNVLTKATVILGIVFLAIIFGLSLIGKQARNSATSLDGLEDGVGKANAAQVEAPIAEIPAEPVAGGDEVLPAGGDEVLPAETAPAAPAATEAAPAAAEPAPAAPAAPEAAPAAPATTTDK